MLYVELKLCKEKGEKNIKIRRDRIVKKGF